MFNSNHRILHIPEHIIVAISVLEVPEIGLKKAKVEVNQNMLLFFDMSFKWNLKRVVYFDPGHFTCEILNPNIVKGSKHDKWYEHDGLKKDGKFVEKYKNPKKWSVNKSFGTTW